MTAVLDLDRRPGVVALAGPNGAGKTTFYRSHLATAGLRFVNADVLARDLELDPYAAARASDAIRRALLRRKESFIFETVFSDPAGDKLGFLKEARDAGYAVLLCFIGLANAGLSAERVAKRVSQGGHDVSDERVKSRFPRILANLKRAVRELPRVIVYDNSDLSRPFRQVAIYEDGRRVELARPVPRWLKKVVV